MDDKITPINVRIEEALAKSKSIEESLYAVLNDKKSGKDVYRQLEVLDKDATTLTAMIYAAYIQAQNIEDPI